MRRAPVIILGVVLVLGAFAIFAPARFSASERHRRARIWASGRAPEPRSSGAAFADPSWRGADLKISPQAPSRPSEAAATAVGEMTAPDPDIQLDFDAVAELWSSERHDADWTENVESYFVSMLDIDDSELQLLKSVNCKRTVCRLEFAGEHVDALIRLQQKTHDDQIHILQRAVPADGGTSYVVFVFRDNAPQLAQGALAPTP